ncbi:Topoisomerase 1-associated factor 1, partial [Ascosphaera atra]
MLYLFRNLAVISPEAVEDEASRSSTITAFQEQDAFALLLTMCSNVAEEFPQQDVVLLETLFHLVKGVNPKDVFRDDGKRAERQTSELKDLLKQEEAVNRSYAKNAPTRHGRFGTMIWVKRDEAKYSTVSGQDVLKDGRTTLLKMDESKKWNRPRGKLARPDASINNFTKPCKLNPLATKHLRTFAEEFLDSGFNPLFMHVQKAMEREAERVTETTPCHFFYLISWFLEAEALRRERQRKAHEQVNGSTWRQIEPD